MTVILKVARSMTECSTCNCRRPHLYDINLNGTVCLVCSSFSLLLIRIPYSRMVTFNSNIDFPVTLEEWNEAIYESDTTIKKKYNVQLFAEFIHKDILYWAGRGYSFPKIVDTVAAKYKIRLNSATIGIFLRGKGWTEQDVKIKMLRKTKKEEETVKPRSKRSGIRIDLWKNYRREK